MTLHGSTARDLGSPLTTRQLIHAAIVRLSLHGEEARPISSTGRDQKWLIDLRPVFLRRDALAASTT
jgi:hypothetical protein